MDPEDIVQNCSQDWQQVKQLQAELHSSVPKLMSTNEPLLKVLEETEKRLKAELHRIKKSELSTIPQNKELQEILLKQAEQKSLEEHKETLAFLRATRADTVESLKKSKAEFTQLQQINEEIKKKLLAIQETELEKRNSTSLDAVLTDMKAKVARLDKTDHYFKQALKDFLAKRFPLPHPDEVKSTLNNSQDIDPNRVKDMKRMLGRLIEQTLNSPQQPYIDIDQHTWPAQVEFLLQCQIVVQHPDNPQKIKLVPFHL